MDYESIRSRATHERRRVNELLALAPSADPFYAETPGRMRAGEWFAEIWQLLGQPRGTHLRRLHYQLISQVLPPLLPDGTPYQNTEESWFFLNLASRNARYLGLVDPTAFEDHRSPSPLLHAISREAPDPDWNVDSYALFSLGDESPLPSLDAMTVDWDVDLELPSPYVSGYDYDPADQPFHLEVWIEKSTMTDVLLPVCQRFGVDLVMGVGYMSVTRVVEMLQRIAEHDKPARILYISDFDPSGEGMPIAVARQAEFWLPTLAPDADLKLEPLVLTAEQVQIYGLPRTPIKADHKQRVDFENRHGGGAVELDALEALRPGELTRLLEGAISPYVDHDLRTDLTLAEISAQRTVTTAWASATREEADAVAAIQTEAEAIIGPHRAEMEALAGRLDNELTPLRERLNRVSKP